MVECANKVFKIQVNWREFREEQQKIDKGFVQVILWKIGAEHWVRLLRVKKKMERDIITVYKHIHTRMLNKSDSNYSHWSSMGLSFRRVTKCSFLKTIIF